MAIYKPEVFHQKSLDAAKSIILTDEYGVSGASRWVSETTWMLSKLANHIDLSNKNIIDFGCGVGRMSAPLAAKGNYVLGVDMSPDMRLHANQADIGERFAAISPNMLDTLTNNGLRFDLAISIWVLQHCFDLDADANKIIRALKPGGGLFIADMNHRAVPTDQGWIDDHKFVFDHLQTKLKLIQRYPYDMPGAPANLRSNAWLAYFVKE